MGLFACLCLPGLSFITCYLHLGKEPLWYLEFRSIDHIEMLAACWGLPFGFLAGCRQGARVMNRRLLFAGLLLAFIPFTKPILLPVEAGGVLQNQWRNDVCLQCNGSTCGPASLATIFAYYGVKQTQRQIAAASFSCARGTESWYLVRYARKCGFHVRFVYDRQLSHIPAPAILGTGAERAGHFIVLLSAADGRVTIGDPLSGRAEMTEATFCTRYGFNGFAIAVGKERLP